jgi:uncharacterized protein (DUF2235 family)
VCCDGTGNSFQDSNEDSNVVKLYSSLVINKEQRGYYHPGVGTMGDPNAIGPITKKWSQLKGLAFGRGLLQNIGDAYRYLMNTYEDGDRIFLFGFSRGAFTARALASVIHVFGLLCAGNDGIIPYILAMYSQRSKKAQRRELTFKPDRVFEWQFSHKKTVHVHFCGLWDTVSSYGWVYDPIELPFLGSNPIIDIGRHAVSIDERRCYYRDNLWGESLHTQDIRQVWFRGVHSDVGGSYPEQESGLSKITLEWMLVEAQNAGLAIDIRKAQTVLGHLDHGYLPNYVQPDENAILHQSLHGIWWALEYLPHLNPHTGRGWSIPKGQRRTIPRGSYLHESVLKTNSAPKDLENYKIEKWVSLGCEGLPCRGEMTATNESLTH